MAIIFSILMALGLTGNQHANNVQISNPRYQDGVKHQQVDANAKNWDFDNMGN